MPELLSIQDIEITLKALPGWKYENNSIVKVFLTQGFPATIGFVASVGAYCQQHNHHPDYILIKYKEVEIAFSTHSAGGVTEKDVKIALDIEKLPS